MKKHWLLLLCLLTACTTVQAPEQEIPDKPINVIQPEVVVSFAAVGDNLIHGAVYKDAKTGNDSYDFKPMYSQIKPYITFKDVAFVNQETILGGKAMGLSHYPRFNSPEEVAEALADCGFDLVNHASNHAFDKGEKGVINTLKTWEQYPNIAVNGINRSSDERNTPRVIERKGLRIAFLAYTYGTNGLPLPPDKSYLVNLIDRKQISEDVTYAKQNSDILLVSMHWGNEDSFRVNTMQKEYAQYLHELGVDVIIGTHPHTIQPTELLISDTQETLIMYSLGNFLSAQDMTINILEGMASWDIRYDPNTKAKTFENILWTPLVDHFEAGFRNFKVYALPDYNDELAAKHGLQGYKKQTVSLQWLKDKTREVMGNEIDIAME